MNEPIKDSIITLREVQVQETKESLDQAVEVINVQRIENEELKEDNNKLRTHRRILLGISGGLLGIVIIVLF